MTETQFDILEWLNDLIMAENGIPITSNNVLGSSELDSFGYTVFFVDIYDKYECYSRDELKELSIPDIPIINIINRIESCM